MNVSDDKHGGANEESLDKTAEQDETYFCEFIKSIRIIINNIMILYVPGEVYF